MTSYLLNTLILCFRVPGITIATDIICGFPTETEIDFEETMSLCAKHQFPSLFINQFFPRPGTPAARMPRIPPQQVKVRTKKLTDLFYTYEPYGHKIGEIQNVLVTEISHDKKYYVGHNEFYEQVLIPMKEEFMGKMVKVVIKSASKFSMMGELVSEDLIKPGLTEPLKKGQISGVSAVVNTSNIYYALIALIAACIFRIIWILFNV